MQAKGLEGEITYTELALELKNMKNGKSPGNDGYTSELFSWPYLGYFMLRSLNYGYMTGSLPVSPNQGTITCIPKPNKSRLFKNLEADISFKRNSQISFFSDCEPFKESHRGHCTSRSKKFYFWSFYWRKC